MKKNIHPEVHDIILAFTNGMKIKVRSTLGKKGELVVYNAGDWPPETHQAWTKSASTNVKATSKVNRFKDRFGEDFFGS
ncbi:ribosomal protein L31 [Neorickettsia helminthoeca str. Oregon]|uniref:50S ribosomal protein L31 n=1 Tax=Neorickettsia helminthoeca str. Oregon TaxID=1286528 RepID=X5HK22_9RICK|nr:50S ribosomal protein L31 [Neorickettsia helminthoeca]AHX11419.1 ribosomal protein L31 [Neorickettsia helminthoeca str. Oregon]